jgi:3-oxoacyl-[acyl-carrier-protein] synthase-3
MAASTGVKRALLLTGDTSVRTISPDDRSAALLFGDAGTATAIERDETAPPAYFCVGSDGTGAEHLMIKAGQFRNPSTAETSVRTQREGTNIRSDEDLFMNGAEVFTFTLREVPGLLKTVMGSAGWTMADTDAFVMHQANQFMLTHLAKFVKIPREKLVLELADYGNTSSASIPLAMGVSPICRPLQERQLKLIVAGFGVGFSWGAAAITCGPIVLPPPVLV